MAGGAVFKLGSFGNFHFFKKGTVGHRGTAAQRGALLRVDDGHARFFITRDFN
jgi:hypothetical protein